jgi:rhodanese-related sulfurtransferase
MEPGGRAGHVPSAVHQPIDGLYREDGSFRSAAELRSVFAPAVLEGSGELITYCTIGGRAATAWFVLTHLIGRDRVRVYEGSWAEWGRIPDTPVEGPHLTSPHHAQLCVPNALSQPGGYALGAQAGEAAIRQLTADAGFTRFRRAAETPFNLVYEVRP